MNRPATTTTTTTTWHSRHYKLQVAGCQGKSLSDRSGVRGQRLVCCRRKNMENFDEASLGANERYLPGPSQQIDPSYFKQFIFQICF